jgi:putative membrane protein
MAVELALVLAAAAIYARGLQALWASPAGRRLVGRGRLAAFAGGIIAAGIAVSPPVHAAAHELFAAHMAQHVLLLLAAAPLLAGGAPQLVMPRAFPVLSRRLAAPIRRRLPRVDAPETLPVLLVAGTGLYLVALWAWHVPVLYDAAVDHAWVHAIEHATLLGAAMLVWTGLLRPGRKARIASGVGVLCVGLLLAQGGILSALIVFAGEPLYASYASGPDPMADQQIAGTVMWIPGGIVYGIAGVAAFIAWFRAMEDRARRRDGREVAAIARAPDVVPVAASSSREPGRADAEKGEA